MTLKLRIRRIEERLEHTGGARKLQTVCILCEKGMPTESQADAAIAEYKAKHTDWDTEDLIEIQVGEDVTTMVERRLKHLEDRLERQAACTKSEPRHMEIPRETVIAAFDMLKDVGGGSYQYLLSPDELAAITKEELDELNQLTPAQLYDLMISEPSAGVEKQEDVISEHSQQA